MTARQFFLPGLIMCLVATTASAQIFSKNTATVRANVVYGSFNPSDHIRNGYPFGVFDGEEWGGLGMQLRYLTRTVYFDRRLSLGAEFAINTLRADRSGGGGGGPGVSVTVTGGAGRFLNGISLSVLGGLSLLQLERIDLHLEAGLGLMFFVDTAGDTPFTPAQELISSAKIVLSIPVSSSWGVEATAGMVNSFGPAVVFIPSIGIGGSYSW